MGKIFYLIFIFSLPLSAQILGSSGNLIHMKVTQDSINTADTLGFWQSGVEDWSSGYHDAVRNPNALYLIRADAYNPEYFIGSYTLSIENILTGKRRAFSGFSAIDYIAVYQLESNVFYTDKGIWLFDDVFGNSFLNNTDSLFDLSQLNHIFLYHISGMIDSLFFTIINEPVKFFLMNQNQLATLDTASAKQLAFFYEDKPVCVAKWDDNLYFIQTENDIKLYRFMNESFTFVKIVLQNEYFQKFVFRSNNLLAKKYGSLYKYTLDLNDTTFINQEIILQGDIYVDYFYEYAVRIAENELQFFDVQTETFIKSWDLSGLIHSFRPIINYPDIYFHNTKNITALEPTSSNKIEKKIIKTFPNPFNSSTKISLSQSVIKPINVRIYNIEGRQVENITMTTDEVNWSPQGIPSGIYFLIFNLALNISTKKVVYLK